MYMHMQILSVSKYITESTNESPYTYIAANRSKADNRKKWDFLSCVVT